MDNRQDQFALCYDVKGGGKDDKKSKNKGQTDYFLIELRKLYPRRDDQQKEKQGNYRLRKYMPLQADNNNKEDKKNKLDSRIKLLEKAFP
jgi:hypothetical protein